MCGVMVVDAGRSRSTNLGRDAYIHDHCLGYHHNYLLFYQLPNSNLLPTVCYFPREATSENYGPRVYLYHILKSKNTSLQFYLLYFILCFCLSIYHYEIWSLQLTAKGLTTPCLPWVQVFVILCVGVVHEVLCDSPTGLITLVLN